MDPRFEKINDLFINYSLGDFDFKIEISEKLDEIDAFISSINMLGEELKTTTISKNYFNNIFNSVTDMVFVLHTDGTIKSTNQIAERKLNFSSWEIINKSIDAFTSGGKSLYPYIKKKLLKDVDSADLETSFNSSKGQQIPVFCSGSYLFNEKLEKVGYLLIARDLSRIKKYENSLKLSEEKYKKIFDKSSDSIFIMDSHGILTAFNKAGLSLFQYSKKNLGNMSFFDLFQSEKDKRKFRSEINKNGVVIDFKIQLRKKDESIVDCLISANNVWDENDKLTACQGIIKNITKQKETENLVIRTIVDTQEKERMRFSKDLHDSMGQQLSAIKFFLGALKTATGKDIKAQAMIAKSDEVLNNVLSELRNICFNLMPKTLENFGLVHSIKELCSKIQFDDFQGFDISFDPKFPSVDKNLEIAIFRIIQEFINNSIKHSKAKRISISMNCKLNNLIIILNDDGVGFNINNMDKYNGMGLKNVHSRVQSYNGEVKISSAKNKGVKYEITVPIQY